MFSTFRMRYPLVFIACNTLLLMVFANYFIPTPYDKLEVTVYTIFFFIYSFNSAIIYNYLKKNRFDKKIEKKLSDGQVPNDLLDMYFFNIEKRTVINIRKYWKKAQIDENSVDWKEVAILHHFKQKKVLLHFYESLFTISAQTVIFSLMYSKLFDIYDIKLFLLISIVFVIIFALIKKLLRNIFTEDSYPQTVVRYKEKKVIPQVKKVGGSSLYNTILMHGLEKGCVVCNLGDGIEKKIVFDIPKTKTTKIPFLRFKTKDSLCTDILIDTFLKAVYEKLKLHINKKTNDWLKDDIDPDNNEDKEVLAQRDEINDRLSNIINTVKKESAMKSKVANVLLSIVNFSVFLFLAILCNANIDKFKNIASILILCTLIIPILLVAPFRKTHAAEHMAINCYMKNKVLSIENVMASSRFAAACGTNFVTISTILVLAIINIATIAPSISWYYIITLPCIVFRSNIAYEIFRISSRYKYFPLNWPGLLMQCLTTNKPSQKQVEIAIDALREVI